MPLQTRNIAKGVAPRLHQPKHAKPKPKATTNSAKRSHKRHASESEDEQCDRSEPKKRGKKRARQVNTSSDSESEVEEVDDDTWPPTIENVVDDDQTRLSEDNVSTNYYYGHESGRNSFNYRMMDLTTINEALNFKKCRKKKT